MAKHINLPDDLQHEMEAVARAEGKSLSEVMQDPAERYLNHRGLGRLVERGRNYAIPLDVFGLVADSRRGS